MRQARPAGGSALRSDRLDWHTPNPESKMTRWSHVLLAVGALATLPCPPVEVAAQERPRVAVIDLENRTTWWANELGGAAADVLTTRLVQDGTFTVVERSRLQSIIEEQGLQMSGIVNPDHAVQIGRVAGVHYMILGSISRFSIDQKSVGAFGMRANVTEAESALNVRVISTETAEIVAAAEGDGKKRMGGVSAGGLDFSQSASFSLDIAQEALEPALDKIVEGLVGQQDRLQVFTVEVPLEAAAVVGLGANGAVYINRGANADTQVGQRFAVMRVVDEIVSSSGEVLDVVTEQVGIIEVVRVLDRSAVCSVVEGAAPEEGDQLTLIG